MKYLIVGILFSLPALAQFPKMPDVKNLSKQVLEACKDDKSKIKGCESYTELKALKTCLMKNEEQLSDQCKSSLKLVK